MVQHAKSFAPQITTPSPVDGRSPRLWGLTPRELHDAFWRSRGVQSVIRGQRQKLARGAELFLLIEPDQLVLFDIGGLTERLTWRDATVTRLRLIDADDQSYSEHVITDRDGLVVRIERRYRPEWRGSSRVALTSSRRIARLWMNADTRRDGWNRARRGVPWARVDHWKCPGRSYVEGHAEHERQMIDELVQRWPSPDQVIDGLERMDDDVFVVNGTESSGAICLGPLWLGRGVGFDDEMCVVGPAWFEDRVSADLAEERFAALREIHEIESNDAPRQADDYAQPDRWYSFAKRSLDILASASALMVLLPLMILIAVAIVVEDGVPLFFGHRRQGRGGKVFRCWKFRTMRRDAHKIVPTLKDRNICDGPQVFIQNDPRVTRVGRFLRRWNLDEFPQFWNVLIGQMSLVGPRPSPDDENQYCPAWRDLRLSVRPGITGLWQLRRTRQPGEDFQEWIKYDIQYVRQAGLRTDIAILFKTALMLLRGRSHHAGH